MDSAQVAKWTKELGQFEGGSDEYKAALANIQNTLQDRGDRMDAHNRYDVDDYGDQATGMGRFASLQDVQATIDAGETPDDIRNRLAKETWGALSIEKEKNFGDHGTTKDLDNQLKKWRAERGEWVGETPGSGETYDPQKDWTPGIIPKRPDKPAAIPKNVVNTDYINQNVASDTFTSTDYSDAQKTFTAEQGNKVKAGTVAEPNVMSRLTDTSAQGVRMKRSKVSQSGQAQGTSQFKYKRGKAQSLNLS